MRTGPEDVIAFSHDDRPSRKEAEDAVRTLLRWIGEDVDRPGLLETPKRVVSAYDEYFYGYGQNPEEVLKKTFDDIENYDDMVLIRNIDFVSHCEHHMAPIIGKANVAYWPQDKRVVGLSKLARVVDIIGRRLTSQENMTAMIVDAIDTALKPKGVAVMIDADHQCMSTRGANKACSSTITTRFSGIFQEDAEVRQRFLNFIK